MGERNSFDRVESAECSVVFFCVSIWLLVCFSIVVIWIIVHVCAVLNTFMLCCMFVVIFGRLG